MNNILFFLTPKAMCAFVYDDFTIRRVLNKHLEKDSPYNTYKYKGLPPGPIANPGLDAINATLYPNTTDYLFFALQEDGTHKFSKTYEEHLKTPKINP